MSWLDTNQSGGVGRADIDRAIAAGRSQKEIRDELSRLQSSGYNVGEKAKTWGGGFDPAYSMSVHKDYQQQIGQLEQFNKDNYGSIGLAAVERARAAGVSDQDIRTGIEKGRYKVGQQAFDALYGGEPTPVGGGAGRPYRSSSGLLNFMTGFINSQDAAGTWNKGPSINSLSKEDFYSYASSRPEANAREDFNPEITNIMDKRKDETYKNWLYSQKADPQSFLNRYLKDLV
jgi:hypothetical protein